MTLRVIFIYLLKILKGSGDTRLSMFGLAPLPLKRGPKAPKRVRRAPQPSAGARRKGAECPELLVV